MVGSTGPPTRAVARLPSRSASRTPTSLRRPGCAASSSPPSRARGSEVCIKSSAVPDARVGTAYTHALRSTPSSVTWTWKKVNPSPTLPPGLTLNAETGVLSGTPTQAGVYEFNVTATAGGLLPPAASTLSLKLTVY
ncbi:Ig domain-containing protein [Archangium gephyra]|uniref:Ig domain-containing protein n=1 Tax=Archangium gephyra TaxID=48 RepID=UPI003B7CB52D